MSANSDHDTMQEAMNAGIDSFMEKPFTIDAFNTTAHKLLLHYPSPLLYPSTSTSSVAANSQEQTTYW